MNNLEAIFSITDDKKNIGSIRDIDKDNAELEQKIHINLKRRTALAIKKLEGFKHNHGQSQISSRRS